MSKVIFRSVRQVLAVNLTLMLLLLIVVPSLGRDDVPELPAPDGSSYTPEIIIPLLDKGRLKLSSLRGRVVLLDFFWSKCQHCRDHAPHIVELYQQYHKRGFTVLSLATDPQDKIDDVKAFVAEMKMTYPVGFITTEVIAYYADSHNHGVPQMVLFGPDGKMVKRWIGWTEPVGKELREKIVEQLQRLPVVKPGSKATGRRWSQRDLRG
jgi:thiol-disulfide isomerase/thioredoxin